MLADAARRAVRRRAAAGGGRRRLRRGRRLPGRHAAGGGGGRPLPAGGDARARAARELLRGALRARLRVRLRGAGDDARRAGRRPAASARPRTAASSRSSTAASCTPPYRDHLPGRLAAETAASARRRAGHAPPPSSSPRGPCNRQAADKIVWVWRWRAGGVSRGREEGRGLWGGALRGEDLEEGEAAEDWKVAFMAREARGVRRKHGIERVSRAALHPSLTFGMERPGCFFAAGTRSFSSSRPGTGRRSPPRRNLETCPAS